MKHFQYFNLCSKTLAILTMLDSIKAAEPNNHAFLNPDKQVKDTPLSSLKLKNPSPILHSRKSAWDNAYIGLILGNTSGSTKHSSLERGNTFLNSQSSNLAFNGPEVEFAAGWGKTFDKYYLGLEAFYTLSNSKGKASQTVVDGITNSSNTLISTVRKKNTFGSAIRGGYTINRNGLVYGKLGVISTQFNIGITNRHTQDSSLNFAINSHPRLLGTLLAVGTEVQLTQRLLGRIEASHNQYNKKNFTDTPDNTKSRFNPYSNEIKVGLTWLLK
ncbi:MAG: outer membrane beta-barrel protein [Alphaproteobacteria bacterium]|nr:outer membrane beta-barrel protein [Alphaproteobacteria bacterium]